MNGQILIGRSTLNRLKTIAYLTKMIEKYPRSWKAKTVSFLIDEYLRIREIRDEINKILALWMKEGKISLDDYNKVIKLLYNL